MFDDVGFTSVCYMSRGFPLPVNSGHEDDHIFSGGSINLNLHLSRMHPGRCSSHPNIYVKPASNDGESRKI